VIRRGSIVVSVLVAVGIAGVVVSRGARRDPYVAHLEERIAALLPAVERELGATVPGPIRVVVSTREELGALFARENRDLMRAIEGEPRGSAPTPPDDSKCSVDFVLGCVDVEGTIHVCREELEGAPRQSLDGKLSDLLDGPGDVWGPEVLDWTLAHELVHVWQVRAPDAEGYLRSARHRSDLLARRAVMEGQAEAVTSRVMGRERPTAHRETEQLAVLARATQIYEQFEITGQALQPSFPYVQGRVFVESAIARLGRNEALRRLFSEPPELVQVDHPKSWPGTTPPDAGTEAMIRRARMWLETEWEAVECKPMPPSLFVRLLHPAGIATEQAAFDALVEVQHVDARVWPRRLLGHLLAARDEAGARRLYNAWIEAARARDAFVPEDRGLRRGRVLESAWSDVRIDGAPAQIATRRYRGIDLLDEAAVVVQHGRYALELRLVRDPGGTRAVQRLARSFLACVLEDRGDANSAAWDARWRSANDARLHVAHVHDLLGDTDADVRHAALSMLLRRNALSSQGRERTRRDEDPLVRLTGLTGHAPGYDPDVDGLVRAADDADPWVAAGAFAAARASCRSCLDDELVARALRRPEAEVRRAASDYFGFLYNSSNDADETLAIVCTALADEDAAVRERGAAPLLHIASDTPGLAETFTELLTGADEDLRRDVLGKLTIREPVPGTADALATLLPVDDCNEDAAAALAKLGPAAQPAVPALRKMAADAERAGDTSRRLRALGALARISGDRSEVVEDLRGLLATGSPTDALLAANTIEDIGPADRELVLSLAASLVSDDRRLVARVLKILEKLGHSAEPALPAIDRLYERADPAIRERAKQAREAIAGATTR
jgi:hypothetical protein